MAERKADGDRPGPGPDGRTVAVIGATGQVGRELTRLDWGPHRVIGLTRLDLDLTDHPSTASTLDRLRPSVVINAAAYTAVDRAEDEPEVAEAVNHLAVANLARWATDAGADLVQLSTDYVFDGSADGWYTETDEPRPTGVYGRSKRMGELAALETPGAVVVRTAWVYSSHGSNFVKTMRRLGVEREVVGVVADQRGCPTSAAALAVGLRAIVNSLVADEMTPGVYHLAAPDDATWFDLADETFRLAGLADRVRLDALTTAQYPTRARRPPNSRLDSSLMERTAGIHLPPWRESLAAVNAELDLQEGVLR